MDRHEDLVNIKINLHTGSRYFGLWNPILREMDVEGNYLYPDSTRYKGEFRNGVFHGIGRIYMPPPCNFSFSGEFENGKLIKLNDMMFGDNLRFDQFDGKTLNLKTWEYCEEDRRYTSEIKHGLKPVGTKKDNLSCCKTMRIIHKGQYDNEEGIFNAETGIITRIPVPFHPTRFMQCPDEREWIKRYCRYGGNPFEDSPISEIGLPIHEDNPKIMKFNIESAEIEDAEKSCICHNRIERKRYFDRFIERLMAQKDEIMDDNYSKSSTASADSFCEPILLDTLNKANMEINKARKSLSLDEFNSTEEKSKYELYKSSSYLIAPPRMLSTQSNFTITDSEF